MPKQRSLRDIRERPFLDPSHPTVNELRQLDRLLLERQPLSRRTYHASWAKGTLWRTDILRITPQKDGKDVAKRIRLKPKIRRLPRSLAKRMAALGLT